MKNLKSRKFGDQATSTPVKSSDTGSCVNRRDVHHANLSAVRPPPFRHFSGKFY